MSVDQSGMLNYLRFVHRARAAFLAISLRRFADKLSARAGPPN